jgi:glycosyltransferase involved in cell wall biosynthesis
MRILVINDFSEVIGGVETYICNIINNINDKYDILFYGGQNSTSKFCQQIFSLFNIKYFISINNIIKNYQPDLIWVHSISENISPSFLLLINNKKIPVIMTIPYVHQYSFKKLSQNKVKSIFLYFKKKVHRIIIRKKISMFIAPSSYCLNEFKKDLVINNIRMIENPVFWNIENKTIHIEKIHLLFVGSLEYGKGIADLLSILNLLNKQKINFICTIIGKGTLYSHIQKNLNSNNVELIGYVPNEIIIKYYRDADILLLPSTIEENCPLSIIEALSQGTPVITTNIGGQAELIKNGYNGYLYTSGNYLEAVEHIKSLYYDRLKLQLLSNNSVQSAHKYSLENHIKQIDLIFKYALSNRDKN